MKSIAKDRSRGFLVLLMAVLTVLIMGIGMIIQSDICHAETNGVIVADSCNIRKEATTSSTALASAKKGDKVDVIGQVTGADGKIWYQVYVDANSKGYIRSDCMSISDGSTPPTLEGGSTTTPETPVAPAASSVTSEGVTVINPVSGSVTGGQAVRVRSDASTSSSIVTTASNGLAVTLVGTKNGADGKTWYKVSFIENNAEIQGFIRSDFVTAGGEITPYVEETEPAETPEVEEPVEEPVAEEPAPAVVKTYDTEEINGVWYLVDNVAGSQYNLGDMMDVATGNQEQYNELLKTTKKYKIAMIVFIVVAILAVAGAAFLYMKWKDAGDAKFMSEAEKNNQARKEARAGKPAAGTQNGRPAQRGPDGRPVQRTADGRPVQRTADGKPVQRTADGRPVQRTADGKPVQRTADGRPVQRTADGRPVQRTADGKPVQRTADGQARPQTRPADGAGDGVRSPKAAMAQGTATPKANPQPRRIINDDDIEDEFDFGFLHGKKDE